MTLSLVAGQADNALFLIVGSRMRSAADFDFETNSSYTVLVRATNTNGNAVERMFVIAVVDVADE